MDDINEEIRRRADIVEVVGQYVALRPAGPGRWKACCPFHDEKTPSFNVSQDKGFYHCFGCGVSGDVFKFVQQMENISFPEAKRQLAERYGVVIPRHGKDLTPEQQAAYAERDKLFKIMSAAAAFFREQFRGNAGMPARDYARERGLSNATVERFGIGYAPDSWDGLQRHLINQYGFAAEDAATTGMLIERTDDDGKVRHYDRYRHRLMFPIWDEQGRTIAFGGRAMEGGKTGTPDAKYINSPEGPLFKKSRTLYGWHLARTEIGKRESVVVTEGYMDTIALHEAGVTNVIATLGTALTVQHVTMLQRLAPKVVYLCYDGDSAGLKAAMRAGPLFAAHALTVRVVTLPGGDDPDTYVRQHGAVGFENALAGAPLMAQFQIERAIAGKNLRDLAEWSEAVRDAAEIIVDVPSELEKENYIAWLADQKAHAEGIREESRKSMILAAVRYETKSAGRRRRQNEDSPYARRAADDGDEVHRALTNAASGKMSGVVKAERSLLVTMLNNPPWRARVLRELPIEKWTDEAHAEIVSALQKLGEEETVSPTVLMEQLDSPAAGLMGELMLSDEAQTPASDEVVVDWIARVQGHWKRQTEMEALEMIRLKLERGETISDEERAAFNAALVATGRKKEDKTVENL